jgi:hypothetical protein
MANTNAPFGLRPIGRQLGATTNFEIIERKIAFDDTAKGYRGDLFQNLNTGYVTAITASPGAVAVSQVAGVFWGVSYLSTALGRRVTTPYWPGADTAYDPIVQLIPCTGFPPGLFLIQSDATGVAFADIGLNADITYAAGTAYTGWSKSGVVLRAASLATTATLPLRVIDLWSNRAPSGGPGTEAGAYNWVVVEFNAMQETGL